MTSPKRNLKRNKDEEVILLHQLQYIDQAYNIALWAELMNDYHKVGNKLMIGMCSACVDRARDEMMKHREYLETHGAEVPELPT